MKRSKSIRLVLLGGLTAGMAFNATSGDPAKAPISATAVYTNNFFVPGVGYYHAPFRQWYPVQYNYYDLNDKKYFYGGQWGLEPHRSITNISSPSPDAATLAQAQRTDIPPAVIHRATTPSVTRSGFGSTSRSSSTWS